MIINNSFIKSIISYDSNQLNKNKLKICIQIKHNFHKNINEYKLYFNWFKLKSNKKYCEKLQTLKVKNSDKKD